MPSQILAALTAGDPHDIDRDETRDWIDSLNDDIERDGMQRLDSPVRGNGIIIQEMETLFAALVANMSDRDIDSLVRGGHDPVKIHAAYAAAVAHRGQPTVILAQTWKGYGMGRSGQASNAAHQAKKVTRADVEHCRERFGLPPGPGHWISDPGPRP